MHDQEAGQLAKQPILKSASWVPPAPCRSRWYSTRSLCYRQATSQTCTCASCVLPPPPPPPTHTHHHHAFTSPSCTATLPIPAAPSLQLIIPEGAEDRCYVEMEPQVVQFRTDALQDPDSHDTVMAHEVRRPLLLGMPLRMRLGLL